ncbi:hypothetical protein MMC17_009093 [Xylographa soralifera]|nr:hypothetical protein [Xylographa soralifera]
MEALGAAASVVGIVSLGIQIGQILQKQIDDVRNADLRLLQMVYEIGATAASLQNLRALLLKDEENPSERIFSHQCYQDIISILSRCNVVFRNITVLVAKSGTAVLALVDDFQRKMDNSSTQDKDLQPILNIELSSIEHLMWPWRLPKIAQYVADLDRLKQTLLLILAVNSLAKKTILKSESDVATLHDDDEDALLVDEVFYKNIDYHESESKYAHIMTTSSEDSHASSGYETCFQQDYSVAEMLVQNWPHLPQGGVPSPVDLAQMGVILEVFTLKLTKPGTPIRRWMQMPVTLGVIQGHLLRNAGGIKAADTIWSKFSLLPEYLQCSLRACLDDLEPPPSSKTNVVGPTLLSIELDMQRRRRTIEKLKSLTPFYGHSLSSGQLAIVVAWAKGSSDQSSGRPIPKTHIKPLIDSPISSKVSRQLVKPLSHERLRPTGELRHEDYPVASREKFEARQQPQYQYSNDVRDLEPSSYKQSIKQANTWRHGGDRKSKTERDSILEDTRFNARFVDPVVNSRRPDNEEPQALDQNHNSSMPGGEEQHTRRQIEYGESGFDHSEIDRRISVVDSGEDTPGSTSSAKQLQKQYQARKKRHSSEDRRRLRNEIKLARENETKLEKRQTELECELRLQEERYRLRAREAAVERRELELEFELEGKRQQRIESDPYVFRQAGSFIEHENSYDQYHGKRDISPSMPFRPRHQVRNNYNIPRDQPAEVFGFNMNDPEVSHANDWGVARIPSVSRRPTPHNRSYTGSLYTRPYQTRTDHNVVILPSASTFRSERFDQNGFGPNNDIYARERQNGRTSKRHWLPDPQTLTEEYTQVGGYSVDVLPTEEEKVSVAQYYIRKWTTTIDHLRERARKRLANKKERLYDDGHRPPSPFLPRPSTQQNPYSTTTYRAESSHPSSPGKADDKGEQAMVLTGGQRRNSTEEAMAHEER